jgi:hypothetical protein
VPAFPLCDADAATDATKKLAKQRMRMKESHLNGIENPPKVD